MHAVAKEEAKTKYPTPNARDGDPRGTQDPDKRKAGGHTPSLNDVIEKGKTWATPTANRQDMYTMEQARTSGQARAKMKGEGKPFAAKKTGQLNPYWTEWLMGWPVGWTDLEPLARVRFLQWFAQHGCCCW